MSIVKVGAGWLCDRALRSLLKSTSEELVWQSVSDLLRNLQLLIEQYRL
jgi:hypothetical protein